MLKNIFIIFIFLLLQPNLQAKEEIILISTSMGDIKIKLLDNKTPLTKENFLQYMQSGFYNDTIFHRADRAAMIIQGGGYTADLTLKTPLFPAIKNEALDSPSNTRGTIAMAARGTIIQSQFFINLTDNSRHFDTDFFANQAGFAVFAEVIEGMDIVEQISLVKTKNVGVLRRVPLEPIIIQKIDFFVEPEAEPEPEPIEISDKTKSETLFNWAEEKFPELFPNHLESFELTLTSSETPFLVRGIYPTTQNYMGTNNGDVFVFGELWNGLAKIGKLNTFYEMIIKEENKK